MSSDPYSMIAPLYLILAVLFVLVMWILDRLDRLEGRKRKSDRERRRSEAEARQESDAEDALTEPCGLCPEIPFEGDCAFCGSRPGRAGRVLR